MSYFFVEEVENILCKDTYVQFKNTVANNMINYQ